MSQTIVRIALCVTLVTLLAFGLARAEGLDISAIGFYQFGGLVDETTQEEGIFTYGEALGINGSGGFGLVVDYRLGRRTVLEASWDLQLTALNHHVPDTIAGTADTSRISDLKVHYYMIGLVYDWSQTATRPYIGGAIGVVSLVPNNGYRTETHPAFSVVLGCRRSVSRIVSLHVRGRVALSKIPKGSLFFDEYNHHKETFMPQVQIGAGIGIAL